MGLSYIWVCATIRALVQISADIRTRHVDLAFQEIVDRLMNHILFSQVVSESSRLQYIRTCPCGLLGKDIIFGAKCMVADEGDSRIGLDVHAPAADRACTVLQILRY
ncbi:hypothetical protein DPMN_191076 [Dreissena polymorpha]|uniref:Uncharacterized protein n=1 Tax=Dreissena polymorpha TaxID=45954 RepID=A0A9D3XZS4_DREPO|nr:hypothetical protein DPMN_191076 [Dreissena polymorpha]